MRTTLGHSTLEWGKEPVPDDYTFPVQDVYKTTQTTSATPALAPTTSRIPQLIALAAVIGIGYWVWQESKK